MLAFEPISIWMKKSGTKICFLAFSLLLKHLRDVQLVLWRERGEWQGDHVSIYRFAGLLGIITAANDTNLSQMDFRKESRSLSFRTVEHSQHGPFKGSKVQRLEWNYSPHTISPGCIVLCWLQSWALSKTCQTWKPENGDSILSS